jgi:membrane carboxypeptidase/penicillin-binding protein
MDSASSGHRGRPQDGHQRLPPRGSEDYAHWTSARSVLGVVPVSVLDMASAFGVLANKGVRCPPYSIARIDARATQLFEQRPDCTG